MLFNSIIFVIFATLFFTVNAFLRRCTKLRLLWLIIASFFFYGWWDWRFLFLIIFSGLVDYCAALIMHKIPRCKKVFFVLSILANVGSLALFKYSGFVVSNVDAFLGLQGDRSLMAGIPEFFTITPIGISFYTFQSMSYTFDVYRGRLKPTKSIIQFFAYLAMFPQLVAGPIVRAKEMLPQLLKTNRISDVDRWKGFTLVVRGYFKKMVIADNLAPFVVAAFSAPEINSSSWYWWVTVVAFAFQIYCDFAGYSDIARGLAKWMGYDFPDNFNHPYISTSLKEFWTRWHISLSTWFRDYVYFALGGNKKGKIRTHINLWITMIISGLWHGAAWTYIAWGTLHAFFLSLEKITKWSQVVKERFYLKPIAWLIVILQVLVGWVFFRADSIDQAIQIIKVMFSFKGDLSSGLSLNGQVFLSLIIFREIVFAIKKDQSFKVSFWGEIIFYGLIIFVTVFFRGQGSEFIYFQF